MADFKNIKDTVISTLATAAEKTKDFADKAVDKAKDVSRIAKLNIELNAEKSIMEKAFSEIGKLYYETRKDNPDGFFVQLCDEITLARENIENIQAEIESIKTGTADAVEDSIAVEFTEVSDDEFEKTDAPKSEGCGCGCGCSEPAEEPKE